MKNQVSHRIYTVWLLGFKTQFFKAKLHLWTLHTTYILVGQINMALGSERVFLLLNEVLFCNYIVLWKETAI